MEPLCQDCLTSSVIFNPQDYVWEVKRLKALPLELAMKPDSSSTPPDQSRGLSDIAWSSALRCVTELLTKGRICVQILVNSITGPFLNPVQFVP